MNLCVCIRIKFNVSHRIDSSLQELFNYVNHSFTRGREGIGTGILFVLISRLHKYAPSLFLKFINTAAKCLEQESLKFRVLYYLVLQ